MKQATIALMLALAAPASNGASAQASMGTAELLPGAERQTRRERTALQRQRTQQDTTDPRRTNELREVSTISFEPFYGKETVSWVQPLADGSRDGSLHVVDGDRLEPVQTDRMTDDLVLCTARIADQGTGSARIVRAAQGEAQEPLAGKRLERMKMVLTGQHGERYVADLGPSAATSVIYEGPHRRTERRTASFLQRVERGVLDEARPILGVHAYVTTRAGTDVVEIDLRVHNGAHRADRSGFGGKVYYSDLELRTPGYRVLEGDAPMASGQDVFPPRAQLVRRFVIAPEGPSLSVSKGFRTAYADGGDSYFSLPRFGANQDFVPRVNLDDLQHNGADLNVQDSDYQLSAPFRVIHEHEGNGPGGGWIETFPGGRRGLDPRPDSLRVLRRIADRVEERMPIGCYDRETGEPLTSRDFAQAFDGRQPFLYDVQARFGIVNHLGEKLPGGLISGDMGFRRSHGSSINQGSAPYEALLGSWFPYDGQHLVRGFSHAHALWSWTGDALSRDWIRMVAADAGYAFTLEELAVYPTSITPGTRSLAMRLADAEALPGQGGSCDRRFAWISVVTVIATQIEGSDELKARSAGLLRLANTLAMPNGIPWRIVAGPHNGGNSAYWTDFGTPEDVDACGTFQVPMIAFAMSALAKVGEDAEQRNRARHLIVRMAETVLDPANFKVSGYDDQQVGPPKSTWVAEHGGRPFYFVKGSGASDPTNYPVLYALAAEASGSDHWFDRIEDLGHRGPKNLMQMATSNSGFAEAFAARAMRR